MAPKRKAPARSTSTRGKTKGEEAEQSTTGTDAGSGHQRAWLMKAEPDERTEKGIDISFSVDKFASMPDRITPWDGVRNPEARTMMKEKMRIGDKVLFYHSNCKLPGIAGLAHVVKEGYPDHTAWDAKHPYFDPKTDKDIPKWYMVDVKLDRKLANLVPLALLQTLRDDKSKKLDYLTSDHRTAISSMQLLNRGRLSVQHVEPLAYEAVVLLGDKAGWQNWPGKWQSKESKRKETDGGTTQEEATPTTKKSRRR